MRMNSTRPSSSRAPGAFSTDEPDALQTVGRQAELGKLQENLNKGIDSLLVGPVGVGKSHLLGLLEGDRTIRVKGLGPVRQAIIEIAEALHNAGVFQPEDDQKRRDGDAGDFEAVKKRHTRTSIQGWTEMVLDSVKPNAWVLIVDDLSDLTASAARLIHRLNKKFVIIAALHEVKAGYEKYFWRFDRVALANLPRADARQLIRQCAVGADVEDLRMLQTCVLQQSAGNPRAIVEIVGRLRKEAAITRSAVRDVVHTGARPRIDLTPGLIVVAMVLLAARFIARGIGSVDGYVIAGVGSAFVMGIRFFLYRFRR